MVAVGWRKRGGSKPIKFTKEKTMTKDKALRMALEALEGYVNVVVSVNDPNEWTPKVADAGEPARKAITAIKEALAQPEQEPVSYSGNGTAGRKADVRPTAFGWSFGELVPWYTTPPQRKPLTRERLVEMAEAQCGLERTFEDWVELFAREIEAAHGIKEREKNNAR